MQFIEVMRLLVSNWHKLPMGGPHLLLSDAMEILNAKKLNLSVNSDGYYLDKYEELSEIPSLFGLADNGLTIECRLYQNVAKLIKQISPEQIQTYDSGSLVFNCLIEANLAANLHILSPEVRTI